MEKKWENNCVWIGKKKRGYRQFYRKHVKVTVHFFKI